MRKIIEFKVYSSEMREKVLSFLEEAFMESGKRFEPEGRHYAFADIERNFMKFWCAFDDEEVVGEFRM